MRIFILITVILLSCKDHKLNETISHRQMQIDSLINVQNAFAKPCHADSQFFKMGDGGIDTAIRTFYCDSSNNICILKRGFTDARPRPSYQLFFNKGKVMKMIYSVPDTMPKVYYIDQDTILGLNREASVSEIGFVQGWISLAKNDSKDFDSIKSVR